MVTCSVEQNIKIPDPCNAYDAQLDWALCNDQQKRWGDRRPL